jgi:hypothetical protein
VQLQRDIPRLLLYWLIQMASLRLLIIDNRIEHLPIHLEARLFQHLADHGSLDFQSQGGNQSNRQPVRIPSLTEHGTSFDRLKAIGH